MSQQGLAVLQSSNIPPDVAIFFSGNSGTASPTSNTINIVTENSTVVFQASGNTITQDFGISNLVMGSSLPSLTTGLQNVGLGQDALDSIESGSDNIGIGVFSLFRNISGNDNIGIGTNTLSTITTSIGNIAIGSNCLDVLTVGNLNVCIGRDCCQQLLGGSFNVIIGEDSLSTATSASQNVVIGASSLGLTTSVSNLISVGYRCLSNLVTCTSMIAIGVDAGDAYTNLEDSNIIIGNLGRVGDNHTIRIGDQGSALPGLQSKCFIAGIINNDVANTQMVTINNSTTQLGSSTLVAGTGISITIGAGTTTIATTGGGAGTITGNSGGALSQTANNWNIFGASTAAGTSPVSTSGAVSTLTVNVQKSQAIASTDATKIGLAAFDSSSFAVDANGFVTLAGGGLAIDSIHPDSGTDPIVPTAAGLVNIVGSGSTTTVGSLNTLTIQLTGLTNHAVLVGAGTTTITKVGPTATAGQVLQSAGAAADPAFSTATYPSTTTVSQILYSSSTNVVGGLATANQGVLTTGATGIPVITALATNGQLIIGSTAGAPAAATLTAGTGISITNGSNSITIAATSAGFTWTDVTGATQTLAAENGYITDRGAGVTYTLPASGALGDTIKIVGKLGLATITPNANQQILIGSSSGTVGATGTAVSNNVGDCIELVVITSGASTVWRAVAVMGTWTLN